MPATPPADRHDEALAWARRLGDPTFADWDAHVAWLEQSPENGPALDRALLAIEDATAGLAPAGAPPRAAEPPAAASEMERPRRPLALAASLLLALGVAGVADRLGLHRAAPIAQFATTDGERRTVHLSIGIDVTLNGNTRLAFDAAARRVVLDHGEAFFSVTRSGSRPLTIGAGGAEFQDVDTRFDVIRSTGRTELAVQEGVVLFDPAGARLPVRGGQALRIAQDDVAVRRTLDPGDVGGWRSGRLSFADASLADVAADLSRALGRPVLVDPRVADRRFSGVIMADGDRGLIARRVAAVTGLAMTQSGAGWRLAPPSR